MRKLYVRVPDELDQGLSDLAVSLGVSKSSLIRAALAAFITRERIADSPSADSFPDLAEDFIGCVEGPEDLSTNEDYLAEYGQ